MPGILRLVPYDPAWPARFAAEAERVGEALGEHALAIEHVGSTAVPGLGGKPVLDLAVAVADEAAADACVRPLEALGYQYRGPYGEDPRRRYYVRDAAGVRMAQMHLYILPAPAWHEHLAFRDALRGDPALAAAYQAEKWRVAAEVGWNKSEYAVSKGAFVERVLVRGARARQAACCGTAARRLTPSLATHSNGPQPDEALRAALPWATTPGSSHRPSCASRLACPSKSGSS